MFKSGIKLPNKFSLVCGDFGKQRSNHYNAQLETTAT